MQLGGTIRGTTLVSGSSYILSVRCVSCIPWNDLTGHWREHHIFRENTAAVVAGTVVKMCISNNVQGIALIIVGVGLVSASKNPSEKDKKND